MRQSLNRRYRLDALIGSGGMGAVYRAHDRLTGQIVAVKRLNAFPARLETSSVSTLGETAALALAHEFRTLSSLRHPHIVSVLDYGFTAFADVPSDEMRAGKTHIFPADAVQTMIESALADESTTIEKAYLAPSAARALQPYFSMELLASPQPLLRALRPLDLRARIDLIAQMLMALAYLHRRGIVHRDLKPENVLVVDGDSAPHVRVVDFGLSIQRGAWHETDSGIAGTPAYLAPEVLLGKPTTPAADLYAVGVMLYEAFAGEHPFMGDRRGFVQRVLHAFPDIERIAAPPALTLLIIQLLDKDPAARPADAEAVRRALYAACDFSLPAESPVARDSLLGAAAFVGREREVARLRQALEVDARQPGSTHLWLIGGESGVGKSRLIDEMRTAALVQGIAVVRAGAAVEQSGYALWKAPMRALALTLDDLTPFEAGVLQSLIPDIAALTGVTPDNPLPMEADESRARFCAVIAAILRRQPAPTLILLEDVQWGGDSLAILEGVIPHLEGAPVIIFGTYRTEEAPDLLVRFPDAADLRLERLTRAAIAELSESMLGARGADTPVIDLLERATEGNVFFIVETMRALADAAGELDLVGIKTLPEDVFAGGMRDLIARRIARVPATLRPILDTASVMGRALDLAVLEHIFGMPIEPLLIAAMDTAVIEYRAGDGWRFAHDKLREYLLSIQPEAALPALHRQIAEGIEAIYPDEIGKAPILARHWRGAGDTAQERRYLYPAGKQAHLIGSRVEALTWMKRAYALSDDPGLLHATLQALAQITFEIAHDDDQWDEAALYVEQAHDLARLLDDNDKLAESIFMLHSMARLRDDVAAQARCCADLEALLPRVSAGLSSKIYQSLGYTHYIRDEFEQACALYEHALAAARAANHIEDIESALFLISIAAIGWGRFEQAESTLTLLFDMEKQLVDVSAHQTSLGFLRMLQGDYPHAERLFLEALHTSERNLHWTRTTITCADLGVLAWLQGDLDGARRCMERVEQLSARMKTLNPNYQALAWAIAARRGGDGSAAALAGLDAMRRAPGFGWGGREIAHTLIRAMERAGDFASLDAPALNMADKPASDPARATSEIAFAAQPPTQGDTAPLPDIVIDRITPSEMQLTAATA
jgi:serine/threonine protein kinase/tetratricopeptide (TPR) repeat protein